MELKAYSIRDSKGGFYGLPFFKRSHGEAERTFAQLRTDNTSTVNQFPEDFDLYYLGEYDDQTGLVKSLDTPQHMLKASTVVSQ